MIQFINLIKKYKKRTIINNLNLTLPNKGIVLFKGENGTGKTTLLNCITKQIKYKGEIKFDDNFDFTKDIYYSLSTDSLYDYLTVTEKKELLLTDKEKELFNEYIEKYDLSYIIDRKILSLSSGERQKVELIFALSKRKKVTIIDEPFEFIDRYSKPLFIEEVIKLSKEVLVIETCHYDIHDADVIIDFNNNLNLIKNNEVNEEITVENNNEKINYLNKSFKLFGKRPKKRIITFNVITFILVAFILMFSFYSSLDDRKISDIFAKHNLNGGIYYSFSNDYKTESKPMYRNELLNGTLNNISNLMKFNGINNFSGTTTIVESDYINIKGKKVKIRNNEIYIPDYIYDTCMAEDYEAPGDKVFVNKLTYEIRASVPEQYQDRYYPYRIYKPSVQNVRFRRNKVKYDKFEVFNIKYKIRVYDTNYEEYMPLKSYDSIEEQRNDLIKYAENLMYYANFVYVNEYTNTLIHDNFMNIPREKYYTRAFRDYHRLYFKDNLVIEVNFTSLDFKDNFENNFEDNKFTMNARYAKKYLNHDISKDDINKFFDIKIGNRTFKMQFVHNYDLYSAPIEVIKLPYNVIEILHKDGFFTNRDNIESFGDIHIYDKDYIDILKYDEINFMAKEALLRYLSYKDGVTSLFKILFISFVSVSLFLILLYIYFALRPEYKKNRILLNKNLSKINLLELEYMPRILLTVMVLLLSIGFSTVLFDLFTRVVFK